MRSIFKNTLSGFFGYGIGIGMVWYRIGIGIGIPYLIGMVLVFISFPMHTIVVCNGIDIGMQWYGIGIGIGNVIGMVWYGIGKCCDTYIISIMHSLIINPRFVINRVARHQ